MEMERERESESMEMYTQTLNIVCINFKDYRKFI